MYIGPIGASYGLSFTPETCCEPQEHAEYRRKVSDLASRGITVEDLLDFYRNPSA